MSTGAAAAVVPPPEATTPPAGGGTAAAAAVVPPVSAVPAAKVDPAQATQAAAASAASAPPVIPPVVVEKYDLKLPQGSALDPSRVEEISSFAKTQGLTNAQAQGILDREHQANAASAAQIETLKAGWLKSAQEDPEIGGEKLKESAEMTKRVLTRFASERLLQELELTKQGDHPEFIRMMAKIGKAMAPDTLVQGGANGGATQRPEEVFYPNMKKE